MKSWLVYIFVGLFTITGLAGCETMKGMGRDVENAGEEIEDAADR